MAVAKDNLLGSRGREQGTPDDEGVSFPAFSCPPSILSCQIPILLALVMEI